MKPILFNTRMVRAILEGQKTMTRMLIKPQPGDDADLMYIFAASRNSDIGKWKDRKTRHSWNPPYHAEDVLYVRETWAECPDLFGEFPQYIYRANYSEDQLSQEETTEELYSDFPACVRWKPNIHMPKDAARIFLRVKSVRVERLQEITEADAQKEGVFFHPEMRTLQYSTDKHDHELAVFWGSAIKTFRYNIWHDFIPKAKAESYGWEANPWVWVIEFERCDKPREELR